MIKIVSRNNRDKPWQIFAVQHHYFSDLMYYCFVFSAPSDAAPIIAGVCVGVGIVLIVAMLAVLQLRGVIDM